MAASAFTNFLERIEDSDLRAVALHWNEARQSKLMPAWNDIDPAKIRRQLGIVWAYRYDHASASFIARLAGEEIERAFGKTFRGKPMRELFPASEFEDMFRRHLRIVADPCFLHGAGFVFDNLGQSGTGERIAMPLADDGVRADGIFGATKYVLGKAARQEYEEYLPVA